MPGPAPAVHVSAGILCPHGAPAQVVSANARVFVSGQPVALAGDTYPVGGCPFQVPVGAGTKPQPCLTLRWTAPAARVTVLGQPVVAASSTGLALSAEQIPQGPPIVTATQPRAVVT